VAVISNIDPALRKQAQDRCEYCHFPISLAELSFQVDHIIARKHGGATEPDNLALACFYCNSFKGPNIAGIDPQSREMVLLFHPRKDEWIYHFQWENATLLGLTPVGRATIQVLGINDPNAVAVGESLIREGIYPS
jgi:5-methylcytosine-specific restriction endonuclease McrA